MTKLTLDRRQWLNSKKKLLALKQLKSELKNKYQRLDTGLITHLVKQKWSQFLANLDKLVLSFIRGNNLIS